MFSGIDEVDWASMEHAYGPADDVPHLLRGLASDDPAEREAALDGMYGAVHHQGDVYACTLACIPFLFELVVDPGVRDRGGVVELLTSIGGFDLDEDDEAEIDEDEIEGAANYAMAAAAVTAGAEVFVGLISDEDPGVRLAAPLALATLHRHPVRVLALLRERLPVEPDEEVRLALVEAAGRVALRHRPLAERVGQWLGLLADRADSPGLRLAALAQLARCSPDGLPGDVVPVVSGLLREMRAGTDGGTDPGRDGADGLTTGPERTAKNARAVGPEPSGPAPADAEAAGTTAVDTGAPDSTATDTTTACTDALDPATGPGTIGTGALDSTTDSPAPPAPSPERRTGPSRPRRRRSWGSCGPCSPRRTPGTPPPGRPTCCAPCTSAWTTGWPTAPRSSPTSCAARTAISGSTPSG